MEATDGVGGAGSTRDEADAGLAGDLAPRLGHHGGAALLPADDGPDAVGIVQAIERGKEALARHGKGRGGALDLQLINEDLAAVTHSRLPAQGRSPLTPTLPSANGRARDPTPSLR